MEIKFYWDGSFAGTLYSMQVNGRNYWLENSSDAEAKLNAIEILKETYDIDYNIIDIVFVWGGCL